MRLIDETGAQLGVVATAKALEIAKQRDLDLVEVAAKAVPPVCRIMDYGKYKYREIKNQKLKIRNKRIKSVRIRLATGQHDLETKFKNINKFLKKGHKVRIEIQLRGREKAHYDLAREKLMQFVNSIKQEIESIKTDQNIKKSQRGFDVIICQE